MFPGNGEYPDSPLTSPPAKSLLERKRGSSWLYSTLMVLQTEKQDKLEGILKSQNRDEGATCSDKIKIVRV